MTKSQKIRNIKNTLATMATAMQRLVDELAALEDHEEGAPAKKTRRNLRNERVAEHMALLTGASKKKAKK